MFYSGIKSAEFAKPYKEFGESAAAVRKRTARNLLALRQGLVSDVQVGDQNKTAVPPKSSDTLLLATWNIREFDSTKYGQRLPECFYYIAEIISHFDLVAVQEVRDDLAPVRRLLDIMGSWWDMLATDVTLGARGNGERMVFLFDSRKVKLDGIAGEVVIPPKNVTLPNGKKVKAQPSEQLYRTPYVCSFSAHWRRLLMATVHILYGEAKGDNPKRVKEIELVARFMRDMHKMQAKRHYETVILGDFNIFKPEDPTMAAITKAGFRVPKELKDLPGRNVAQDKYYDQIAFLRRKDSIETTGNTGVFDFFDYIYRFDAQNAQKSDFDAYKPAMGEALHTTSSGKPRKNPERYYKNWRTFQMSDHLPMWIELQINFANEYLFGLAK